MTDVLPGTDPAAATAPYVPAIAKHINIDPLAYGYGQESQLQAAIRDLHSRQTLLRAVLNSSPVTAPRRGLSEEEAQEQRALPGIVTPLEQRLADLYDRRNIDVSPTPAVPVSPDPAGPGPDAAAPAPVAPVWTVVEGPTPTENPWASGPLTVDGQPAYVPKTAEEAEALAEGGAEAMEAWAAIPPEPMAGAVQAGVSADSADNTQEIDSQDTTDDGTDDQDNAGFEGVDDAEHARIMEAGRLAAMGEPAQAPPATARPDNAPRRDRRR